MKKDLLTDQMMRPKLIIIEPKRFSARALNQLNRWATVVTKAVPEAELPKAFSEFDILWTRLGYRISRSTFPQLVRCKIIATATTGLDHIDLDACSQAGIQVVSLKGDVQFLREVRATAELTIGIVLALIRRIPEASYSVKDGKWNRDLFPGTELYQKAAGIVGMGRLGSILAGYFKAFGMQVFAYDPYSHFSAELASPLESLDELLRKCDIISLHVDYSRANHHLIGSDAFLKMKKGAILINTSRGAIVDGMALLDALESGYVSGAALDVLEDEPDVNGNPLIVYSRTHTNLLITPHIGGNTIESFEKTECRIAERLREEWQKLKNQL